MQRLNLDEIASLTARKPEVDKIISSKVRSSRQRHTQQASAKPRKSPNHKVSVKPKNSADLQKPLNVRQPRTVRETQNMLRILNQSAKAENEEDEAQSTAAFFQNSPGRSALKQIEQV